MTDDLQAVAANLAKTAGALERHIAAEAQKRAAKLGVQYAKAAQEQVDAAKADARRWQDCNTELRRQMKPLERIADRYGLIVVAARSASWAGEDTISVKTLLDIINNAPAMQATKET